MAPLSIPTTAALDSFQLLPSTHPAVIKTLRRLSRPSLLSLVLDWLDDRNQHRSMNAAPFIIEPSDRDEYVDDIYPPCTSLPRLREVYTDLQSQKGSKRDVTDRILEGDWREGISLYQLAMADMQYLYDHPSSQKWSALKVVRLSPQEPTTRAPLPSIPRFHPAMFLQNLQNEALPDVKAHYNLDRHSTLPLLILRVFILESPYNTSLALQSNKPSTLFDSSRIFYVAFPDSSPHVYVSLTNSISPGGPGAYGKSLRTLILNGISKAFSRPRDRYKLENTQLSAKSLDVLCQLRGGGRTSAASGGWSLYADWGKDGKGNPLDIRLPTPESSVPRDDENTIVEEPKGMKRKRDNDEAIVKRRKLVAQGRFGNSAKIDDGKGIERFDIRLEDPFPSHTQEDEDDEDLDTNSRTKRQKARGRQSDINIVLDRASPEEETDQGARVWKPDIRMTFHGQHVFAGIRELVELGIVDGEKMPGWMTGEEGVSVGVVVNGRIKGFKGSGIKGS